MTQEELYSLLETIGIPIAERVFPEDERQSPPFAVYYRSSNENIYADDKVYTKNQNFVLELYVDYKMPELEEKIEALFNDNEIAYTVEEVYLSDEKMREIIYKFTILGGKTNG